MQNNQNNKERLIFSFVVFMSVLATEIGIFNLSLIIKTSQNFLKPSQAQPAGVERQIK